MSLPEYCPGERENMSRKPNQPAPENQPSSSHVFQRNEEILYPLVTSGELEIDDEGRVWRLATRDRWVLGRLTKCDRRRAEKKLPNGYLMVRTHIENKTHHVAAHRLVWRHFNGQIPYGIIVNHKDGVRDNNMPSNLELTNHAGNDEHARTELGFDNNGELNGNAVMTENKVRDIRRAFKEGAKLDELVKMFGKSRSNIHRIVRRETWKSITD